MNSHYEAQKHKASQLNELNCIYTLNNCITKQDNSLHWSEICINMGKICSWLMYRQLHSENAQCNTQKNDSAFWLTLLVFFAPPSSTLWPGNRLKSNNMTDTSILWMHCKDTRREKAFRGKHDVSIYYKVKNIWNGRTTSSILNRNSSEAWQKSISNRPFIINYDLIFLWRTRIKVSKWQFHNWSGFWDGLICMHPFLTIPSMPALTSREGKRPANDKRVKWSPSWIREMLCVALRHALLEGRNDQ